MINPFYSKKNNWLLVATALIFLSFYIAFGVVETNDSWAFLETNPAVSPLYPLAVIGFNAVFGKMGLDVLIIFQELITAYCIFSISASLAKRFYLRMWAEMLIIGIFLGAYVLRLILVGREALYCNTIMSEAFAFPLFFMFIKYAFFAYDESNYKYLEIATIFSFFLALTRGQLINTAIVLVILFIFILKDRKKKCCEVDKVLWIKVIGIIIVYGIGIWFISCLFHFVSSGSFKPTTMGNEAVLGNVLYNSQSIDAEVLPEENEIREVFIETMEEAEREGITFSGAPSGLVEHFKHYEQSHDTVRDYLSNALRKRNPNLDEENIHYEVGAFSEKALIPLAKRNLGRYISNCMVNMTGGIVRSNSILSIPGVLLSACVYLVSFFLLIFYGRKKMLQGERKFLGLVLIFIAVNCVFCSFGVFELSRYVYYGFPCIYVALLIFIVGIINKRKGIKRKLS